MVSPMRTPRSAPRTSILTAFRAVAVAPRRFAAAGGSLLVACTCAALAVAASQPQSGAGPSAPPSSPAAPQAIPPGDLPPASRGCATECHKEIVNRKVPHGPAQSDCSVCHVQVGSTKDHKFSFILPREDLCKRCHEMPHKQVLHKPVAEGKCLDCHDPHGSDHPRVLRLDPKRDLCLKCHQQDFSKSKHVHGPVAVGACVVCHQPHSSSEPKLLSQPLATLCQSCHAEVLANIEKAGPGMHRHAALDMGCTHCHDPHASEHPQQLRQAAPGLCLTCHKERFDQITAGAKVVHGAVSAEGGCTGCHEPHASRLPALQRGTEPGLCLKCHDKELTTASGRRLTNMAALLAANPDKHGPIREGACTACHSPHAGKHFSLLAEDYPPEFYAPFDVESFKLCFKCHISDLVLKDKGRGLTQFRDGERNLHFVHVNQAKGRTCRACHEVHASKRPAHIREAVPFGTTGWLLEINFEKTTDGGSCAPGCHTAKTYRRDAMGAPPPLSSPGSPAAPLGSLIKSLKEGTGP